MTQKEALDILKMGKNVFLTGAAGSGKTYVLREYIDYLKSHAVSVAVTASTGIASTHLSGQTIHSWSGLGIRDTLTDYDIDDLMQKAYLYKRFDHAKVLIIDEVSMLHNFRLDMVEWICRQFKHNEKPFGGMQVILCGDFFQLPPVTRGEIMESQFAFKAESFENAGFTVCYLDEQHRQNDDEYLSVLNDIRENNISKRTRDLLQSRLNRDTEIFEEPTKLFTHNIDVDVINHKHLDLISGETKKFTMMSKGASHLSDALKKSCLSPEILSLKIGAKVMFTKNHQEGTYVNGTLGVVESYNSYGDPEVRTVGRQLISVSPVSWLIEEEGKIKAEITQYPLRLAWAITVHKSQGMSLDAMEVDLSKSFVAGMGYVALSRVRSLAGMKLLGLNEMSLRVDQEVLEKDKHFKELSEDAVNDLKEMSKEDIARIQKEYMTKIEPDEKKKIKILEKKTKKSTESITAEFLEQEMSISDIADRRMMTQETIVSHIEKLLEKNKCPDIDYIRKGIRKAEFEDIKNAFEEADTKVLSPVFNILTKKKKKPSYLKIRLVRLFL